MPKEKSIEHKTTRSMNNSFLIKLHKQSSLKPIITNETQNEIEQLCHSINALTHDQNAYQTTIQTEEHYRAQGEDKNNENLKIFDNHFNKTHPPNIANAYCYSCDTETPTRTNENTKYANITLYIDSECSKTAIKDKCLLPKQSHMRDLRAFYPAQKGASPMISSITGTLTGAVKDHNNNAVPLIIPDASFVPELRNNLISNFDLYKAGISFISCPRQGPPHLIIPTINERTHERELRKIPIDTTDGKHKQPKHPIQYV